MKAIDSFLITASFLALSLAPDAQTGKVYQRYNKPLQTVSLDLETGAVTRGPAVSQKAAATVSEFTNMDLSGFIAVDTGSCFCEWFDAGLKGHNSNSTDLMNNLVFAYCSSAQDTNSGGPGGTVALGFYEGYSTGGATPSTAVAVFTVTGLPANTGSSSFFGNFSCYFINVELANLVCFADGQIGYKWKFLDGNGTGTLAQTWPFLSCVQSCSGLQDQGGVGGPNMMDLYIDQYCPPGFLRSIFYFGTTPQGGGAPFYISLAMDIREASDCAPTITSNDGQGINLDVQSAPPAVLDHPWSANVTVNEPANPASGVLVLLFNPTSLVTGPRISLFGGPTTELLIGPTALAQPCPVATYTGGAGTVCGSVVLPKDFALIGSPWCTQVLVGTPAAGFTFTNSLCGTVGAEGDDSTWTVDLGSDFTVSQAALPVSFALPFEISTTSTTPQSVGWQARRSNDGASSTQALPFGGSQSVDASSPLQSTLNLTVLSGAVGDSCSMRVVADGRGFFAVGNVTIRIVP